jgi:hypothetical protein
MWFLTFSFSQLIEIFNTSINISFVSNLRLVLGFNQSSFSIGTEFPSREWNGQSASLTTVSSEKVRNEWNSDSTSHTRLRRVYSNLLL